MGSKCRNSSREVRVAGLPWMWILRGRWRGQGGGGTMWPNHCLTRWGQWPTLPADSEALARFISTKTSTSECRDSEGPNRNSPFTWNMSQDVTMAGHLCLLTSGEMIRPDIHYPEIRRECEKEIEQLTSTFQWERRIIRYSSQGHFTHMCLGSSEEGTSPILNPQKCNHLSQTNGQLERLVDAHGFTFSICSLQAWNVVSMEKAMTLAFKNEDREWGSKGLPSDYVGKHCSVWSIC